MPAVNGAQTTVLKIHPQDNVLVALTDLRKGEAITTPEQSLVLQSDVSAKHKFAIQDLKVGDAVMMYGIRVGRAVEPIRQGVHIAQKTVKHSPTDKLYDGFSSLLAGAHGLLEINSRLRAGLSRVAVQAR